MIRVSARQARARFAELVDSAQAGRTVEITRRGKPVARLTPVRHGKAAPLPDMKAFHQRLAIQGEPVSQVVIASRQAARY